MNTSTSKTHIIRPEITLYVNVLKYIRKDKFSSSLLELLYFYRILLRGGWLSPSVTTGVAEPAILQYV